MAYYQNFVLTSDGYKATSALTSKDFTYNRSGRHSRVTYTSDSKVAPTMFSRIATEVDNLPILLRNDKKVYTVDLTTFDKKYVLVEDLTEDHWVFTPWVAQDELSPRKAIDLSKYVDNHHDTTYVYLFNNEILDIANKLEIPFKAVKELLIREAAEYDQHLIKLQRYIYDTYNIIENPNETETSFINFKKYVLKNHIFRMNRYIEINETFIGFLVASLTRATLSQNTFNRNNKYQITYNLKLEDTQLYNDLIAFLKSVNVKFEVSPNKDTISVYNKPLYRLVSDGFLKDISFLFRLEPHLYNKFIALLFLNTNRIKLDLNVLLQIKQAYLYTKQVVAIKDSPQGDYYATLLKEDSLSSLDSTVIFENDGYFSKVSLLESFIHNEKYTYLGTDDTESVYLSCLVKG